MKDIKILKSCPFCGETRSWIDYWMEDGIYHRGILYKGVGTRYYRTSFLKRRKRAMFDLYYCFNCDKVYED